MARIRTSPLGWLRLGREMPQGARNHALTTCTPPTGPVAEVHAETKPSDTTRSSFTPLVWGWLQVGRDMQRRPLPRPVASQTTWRLIGKTIWKQPKRAQGKGPHRAHTGPKGRAQQGLPSTRNKSYNPIHAYIRCTHIYGYIRVT